MKARITFDKPIILNMEIMTIIDGFCEVKVSDNESYTCFLFSPEKKELKFKNNDKLSVLLEENKYQLTKILHNKRKETFYKGFKLKFSIWDKKAVADYNDLSKIVVLDRRKGGFMTYVRDSGLNKIYEIYTDGSFLQVSGKGASVVLIKSHQGEYKLYSFRSDQKGSALVELLAVIKGLEILQNIKRIRIVSDSLYVRKGPTEWLPNWKINNWQTANGENAKNIEYWEKINQLTENKYIEFKWVKGHSEHFENTICDLYAKQIAKE